MARSMETLLLQELLRPETASEAAQQRWREELELHEDALADTVATTLEYIPLPDAADRTRRRLRLLDVVDAVVPYLPEYTDPVSPRLEALFELLLIECPAEADQMFRNWFERRADPNSEPSAEPSSSKATQAFRAWLIQWLSRSKQLPDSSSSGDSRRLQLWRDALSAALRAEDQLDLRRSLVLLLQRLGPGSTIAAHEPNKSSLSSVEELLDFYWGRARELAPSALLCAAKLHALAASDTSRATVSNSVCNGFVQLSDSVLVRLRWYPLLEPLFFRPFLSHCVALQVFQAGVDVDDALRVHNVLQTQWQSASWANQSQMLRKDLSVARRRLQDACEAGAAHVADDGTALSPWDTLRCPAFLALPVQQQRLVLLDLERDLEDAPAALLPHLLVSFGAIVSSALSVVDSEQLTAAGNESVAQAAVRSLFALLDLRADGESCVTVAALIARLRLPQRSVWRHSPDLFAEIVESLNELVALESVAEKCWVVRVTLQQVLFESDAAVVQRSMPVLRLFLPARLQRLTELRLP